MRRRTMLQSARPLGALAVLAAATLAVVGAQSHEPKPAFAGQTDAPQPAKPSPPFDVQTIAEA